MNDDFLAALAAADDLDDIDTRTSSVKHASTAQSADTEATRSQHNASDSSPENRRNSNQITAIKRKQPKAMFVETRPTNEVDRDSLSGLKVKKRLMTQRMIDSTALEYNYVPLNRIQYAHTVCARR